MVLILVHRCVLLRAEEPTFLYECNLAPLDLVTLPPSDRKRSKRKHAMEEPSESVFPAANSEELQQMIEQLYRSPPPIRGDRIRVTLPSRWDPFMSTPDMVCLLQASATTTTATSMVAAWKMRLPATTTKSPVNRMHRKTYTTPQLRRIARCLSMCTSSSVEVAEVLHLTARISAVVEQRSIPPAVAVAQLRARATKHRCLDDHEVFASWALAKLLEEVTLRGAAGVRLTAAQLQQETGRSLQRCHWDEVPFKMPSSRMLVCLCAQKQRELPLGVLWLNGQDECMWMLRVHHVNARMLQELITNEMQSPVAIDVVLIDYDEGIDSQTLSDRMVDDCLSARFGGKIALANSFGSELLHNKIVTDSHRMRVADRDDDVVALVALDMHRMPLQELSKHLMPRYARLLQRSRLLGRSPPTLVLGGDLNADHAICSDWHSGGRVWSWLYDRLRFRQNTNCELLRLEADGDDDNLFEFVAAPTPLPPLVLTRASAAEMQQVFGAPPPKLVRRLQPGEPVPLFCYQSPRWRYSSNELRAIAVQVRRRHRRTLSLLLPPGTDPDHLSSTFAAAAAPILDAF